MNGASAKSYLVLGAGRQGTAIAYDLALHGDARRIALGDVDRDLASAAAARVNRLARTEVAQPLACDASDASAAGTAMRGFDVVVSAVPYHYNVELARAAVEAKASFTDLGGNTDIVKRELLLDEKAAAAGVAIVPDLGLAPGMGNVLAAWAVKEFDEPRDVLIRCGGLPQHPRPPLNYRLVFSVHGLTNEYDGFALALENGDLVRVPTLTQPEEVEIEGVGKLEAYVTSGGTSTCPETFRGKLRTYNYKTLRYPGHFAIMASAKTLGMLSEDPVKVEDVSVKPRALLHALLERQCSYADEDLVVLRVLARGKKNGRDATVTLDLVDRQDRDTGFTAMERTTGYPTSIVAIMMAKGEIAPGARPPELAVPTSPFLAALPPRGVAPRIIWS